MMLKQAILASCLAVSSLAMPVGNSSQSTICLPDAATIKKAADTPTGNKLCPGGTKYFPQPVHHDKFNGDWSDTNATYLQQYEIVDTYYKPGNPVLFYQTPENPLTCADFTSLLAWAKELGALLISLEHRYFGLSCPYGLNYTEAATWELSQMDGLTLDNVLLDGVAFLTWLTTGGYPDAKGAKVIVVGGSYGGALAALYRIRHPDIIYGSLAAAPPTKGLITDPKDSLVYGYADWANMVYNDLSAEAASKIKHSIADVKSRIAAGKFQGIQKALGLCNAINSTDQADAITPLMGAAYIKIAQYNFPVFGLPLEKTINNTLALNDSLAILGAGLDQFRATGNGAGACTAFGKQAFVRSPFDYIVCTYMPYPRSDYFPADSIFGLSAPNTSEHNINNDRCQAMWGFPATNGGADFQRKIGLDQHTLETTKRLIISQGMYDPVTALGPTPWLPTSDRDHSRVLYVAQSGHGGELQRANATDPQAVVEARVYLLNSFREWLGVI